MAAEATASAAGQRAADGRFKPGFSGNPKGKAKGTRHRRTILAEMMREGERETMGRVVIDSAVGGNLVAAKFLFPWHTPRPRGRLLDLELPEGRSPAAIADAYDIVQAALCAAEITIDEALLYARFLEARAAAFGRLAEFERALAERREPAAAERTAAMAEPAAESPSPRPSPRGERETDVRAEAASPSPSPLGARAGTCRAGDGEGEGDAPQAPAAYQQAPPAPAPLHSASIPPARTPAAPPPRPQVLPPPRRRPRRWRWDGKTTWMAG